nr:zinc finger and BTB domain-containing protein 24-like isoform X2 [Halyomorpha halys]
MFCVSMGRFKATGIPDFFSKKEVENKITFLAGTPESENPKQPPTKPACNVCGKFFKKEIHLSQHMKAHDEKQWQCTICSKTFTTKYFLKKHRRLHTGETPYKCSTCSKSFTFQQSYHKHLLYHNDEKPYCCAQCGRLFKELSTLHNHERIHSGEKPFSCETCGKAFRQRVSYLVHRRIHTGAMPYQCTACNKRFRYKISQRTHKCSANPPGVVVRTNGYLVERLQAAMIKASVESDKKTRQNEIDEENHPSHSKVSSESTLLKADVSTSLANNCIASSGLETNKDKNHFSKTADLEKNSSEKPPQIYLLLKGPNEETYYQPIILSQNNNLILNQDNCSQPSEKYLVTKLLSKPMEKIPASDKQCSNVEMSVSDVFIDPVDTNLNLPDGKVLSLPKAIMQEKENDNLKITDEKNDSYQITKNSPNSINNDKNDKDQVFHESSESTSNILSDDYEINDIISSLTCQFSEERNCPEASIQKVNNLKSKTNDDVVMMDSNDIFSLIISPSHSSPSERFGRLSLSPITTTQRALTNSNFDPDNFTVLPDNFNYSNEGQQDTLFDSINDETLKELLFGSSK